MTSLLPFLDYTFGDAFGYGLHPEQFCHALRQPNLINTNLWPGICQRPCCVVKRNICQEGKLNKSNIGKDGFQVCIDVHLFQPNEITVKTVDDTIVVEAESEKDVEDGLIYRQFIRRYQLPKEFDVKDVVASISSDGILTIEAPPKARAIEKKERIIQIQQTGPACLSIKPCEKSCEKPCEKSEKV